jgi:hypothetical protein
MNHVVPFTPRGDNLAATLRGIVNALEGPVLGAAVGVKELPVAGGSKAW